MAAKKAAPAPAPEPTPAPDAPSTTPGAIAAGLSVAHEPGLSWFHRFGPLIAVIVLIGLQVAQETGFVPSLPSMQTIEALLTLLSGGWAARLGMTPPKGT